MTETQSNAEKQANDDYDNPWKSAIDGYLPDFMAFYFPNAHANINWEVGYESLDNELPALVRDAELGNRYADKLVKVTTIDGKQDIVYIHIEVQGQPDNDFSKRMYTYNYRIYDKFGQFPVSLAVLADENESWKPTSFNQEQWGCRMDFVFPVAKLTDYQRQLDDLMASDNPFAILTAAHFLTKRTKHDMNERLQVKLKLAKLLYQKGWDKQEVIEFFRVIDWLMRLPEALTRQFQQNLADYEQESKMRYITSIERLAMQDGVQQGKLEGFASVLEIQIRAKFHDANDADFMPKLHAADQEDLMRYSVQLLSATTLEQVFA